MAIRPHAVVNATPTELKEWATVVERFAALDEGVADVAKVLSASASGDAKAIRLKDDSATIVAGVIGLCQDAAQAADTAELTFRKSAGRMTKELPLDFRTARL